MLSLSNLVRIKKSRKRVGRGVASNGCMSGRGHDGQRVRSGGRAELRPGFEGGQTPIHIRMPKRGFRNVFKKEYKLISLDLMNSKFEDGATVDEAALRKLGVLKGKAKKLLKVVASGKLEKKLTVRVDAVTAGARAAIEAAGGTVEII